MTTRNIIGLAVMTGLGVWSLFVLVEGLVLGWHAADERTRGKWRRG